MIRTALLEFISRGLLWFRVLFISLLMPADLYGYLVLLISAEALFGSIISYPQIKDLLLRQDIHLRELTRTFCLYLLLLPIILGASWFYFHSIPAVLAITIGSLFFAMSQVLLYLLRITDIDIYNTAKVRSAVISTFIFFVVLSSTPNFLPVVSGSYGALLLWYYHKKHPLSFHQIWQKLDLAGSAKNWLIFGGQSAVTNLGMYGSRFVVGISLSLVDVGTFTKSYMIASGVTFYYAAIMIYFEKGLSKHLEENAVPARLKMAAKIGGMLIAGLFVYTAIILNVWHISVETFLRGFLETLNLEVYSVFVIFFVFQAVYLCMNPIVIALGKRRFSLLASVISLFVQGLLVFLYWSNLSLFYIATIMVVGQIFLVSVLMFSNRWRFK
jgi:O-antigen/teichoic acid export membrane protein